MEPTPSPVLAKKLWSMVRIVILMMRKGLSSKSKLMVDFHLMMKRGKIASKAIGNMMFHHHYHNHISNLSCKPQDPNLAFINPSRIRDYEFSCSNSPAFPSFHVSKNRKHHNHYSSYYRHHNSKNSYHTTGGSGTTINDITTVSAVKKVLEMLNNEGGTTDQSGASPVVPGFGGYGRNSPFVRQLRITDSPFPLKNNDDDEDCHVDKEAEEFIKNFYNQLRLQN
ncbi:hypothetical protein MKX01_035033 [Papaver californicum]|nr:hypothetical protein MKX01_035033 [Papaver californicum]